MEHLVYLDNSSTTKPCEKSVEYINKSLIDNWGNPSSLHNIGIDAEVDFKNAKLTVAKSIGAVSEEIIFTSCGTESNNTAIMSSLFRQKLGKHIITTSIEHPSVLECMKRLEEMGFEVTYLDVDSNGLISLNQLENSLRNDTILVSIMLVNNEVGAIEPIEDIVKLVKQKSKNCLIHCDAVQGYGKLPIKVKQLGVDMLSASGHKIHGPKGIGFLYLKKGVHIKPYLSGGGQQDGMRSGTEPMPLIMGLCGAVLDLKDVNKQLVKQKELWEYSYNLLSLDENITINSSKESIPYILNISVNGYRSETLLHYLESKNIYVSSGSACAKGHVSYVLKAMGLDKKSIDSSLRLSFSRYNTKEDIDLFYNALCDGIKKLRKAQ